MTFAKLAESPFLKGTDILTPLTVTIESTRETAFKNADTQQERVCGVLKFTDVDKELILNKTNLVYLLEELGTDERQWIGKAITIRTLPMRNQSGQMARRIFVEVSSAPAPANRGATPTIPPVTLTDAHEDVLSDAPPPGG